MKVSIILVNWNQANFTIPCVKSIQESEVEFDYEIIVVDNGSKDDSVKRMKTELDNFKLIELPINVGFTGGNNIGCAQAKSDLLFILNNDTTLEKDCLKNLVAAIESDPSIGAVNAHEIRNGKRIDINLYKTKKICMNMLQYGVAMNRKIHLQDLQLVDSNSIKGAGFIYRKALMNPPFDEDYFIFADDVKLSWMIKCKGYKLKTATNAVYNHFHNATRKGSSSFNKRAIYLGERNSLMNILTFYSIPRTIALLPLIASRMLFANLRNIKGLPYRLKAYLYIILHPGLIQEKRKEIARIRTVPYEELMKEMTWRLGPRSARFY